MAERQRRGVRSALRIAFLLVVGLIAGLLITLAMPIETWRTGDQRLVPLTFAPAPMEASRRLWIDTDAACGHGRRTDPDDCFAIALLARASGFEIAGISTVFGNAPLDVVDRTTRELAARLSAEVGRPLAVHSGAAAPLAKLQAAAPLGTSPASAAHHALIAALEQGPLTVVALGPLTNLAGVLGARADLQSRIARLVAVMGRRPGHVFHPAEGANAGALFGHGPVFRDFNFVMDVEAAVRVVALGLPTSLIPYDAARGLEVTAGDLDRLTAYGGTGAWVAERARSWLSYWNEVVGRDGFYPFDLMAAAYVVRPDRFGCAAVQAWVGKDAALSWRPIALLVAQSGLRAKAARAAGPALYCTRPTAGLEPRLALRTERSYEFDPPVDERTLDDATAALAVFPQPRTGDSMMDYVDGFVAAVPTANREAYLKHAEAAAVVFKEFGALSVVECWGDDVPEGKLTSFPMAVKRKDDETVVFSWITWPSRQVRDAGMKKVMEDPRLQPDTNPMPFDGKRLIYGGFEMIVNA